MCLIVCAFRAHPGFPLVLVANRDEFHARPSRAAAFWKEAPGLLAGRDLQGGGSWMGVTRTGRLAAVTNYREAVPPRPGAPSRGGLVTGFLRSRDDPLVWLEALAGNADRYAGFSLLAGAAGRLAYFSNRESGIRQLAPGVYGMSNHLLETPWHKVVLSKQRLEATLRKGHWEANALLDILADRRVPEDAPLPETGLAEDTERLLLPAFIVGARYGTRSTTAVTISAGGDLEFVERCFGPGGRAAGEKRFAFPVPVWQ